LTLTQNVNIPLAPHWSLVASAGLTHLLGSAAQSSIVKEVGEVNQGAVQTGVSYRF